MNPTTTHEHEGDYEISSPSVFTTRPTVSVIMLAYNHGEYIEQAIDSVLAQQGKFPIELLIGEDCSQDNTRELALRYQQQNPDIVRIITSDQNVGSQLNSRRILTAARGEFIAYLDGDDYWLPGKLTMQVAFLRRNAGCVAIYTNALTVDRDGNSIGLFNDVSNAQFDLAAMLRHGNFLNNSSMMFRATVRPALLEISDSHIDYRTHLRLARDGHLAQLAESLTVYRIGAQGSMVAQANDRVRELYWEAIQSVPRDQVRDDDFAHAVADFLRRVFFRAVRTRKWQLLREWAPRVFKASPYGRMRTTLLTGASIVRVLWKESLGMFRRDDEGHRLRILYRR